MIKPSHFALWRCCSCAALVLACATIVAMTPGHSQERATAGEAARENPAVATDGATLIHGNYCGAGNRPGTPPIDALDLACMNHDACTPAGDIATCDCNVRLRDEAAAVAQDPRQAQELRSLASLTATAAAMMICKPMINAAAPPAAVTPAPVTPAPVTAAHVRAAPAPIAPGAVAPVSEAPASGTPAHVTGGPQADAPASAPPVSKAPSLP